MAMRCVGVLWVRLAWLRMLGFFFYGGVRGWKGMVMKMVRGECSRDIFLEGGDESGGSVDVSKVFSLAVAEISIEDSQKH